MTDASNGCYDIPDEVTSYRYLMSDVMSSVTKQLPDGHDLRDKAVTGT